MADVLITDEEISILCDVLEGRGGNFSAGKKNLLDQPIVKGFVTASDQVRTSSTCRPLQKMATCMSSWKRPAGAEPNLHPNLSKSLLTGLRFAGKSAPVSWKCSHARSSN
jgi:hypothetical protein